MVPGGGHQGPVRGIGGTAPFVASKQTLRLWEIDISRLHNAIQRSLLQLARGIHSASFLAVGNGWTLSLLTIRNGSGRVYKIFVIDRNSGQRTDDNAAAHHPDWHLVGRESGI